MKENSNVWIREGNYGMNYGSGRELEKQDVTIEDDNVILSDVYLNCEGNIILGCDWSYESQRREDLIVCKANENILDALKAKEVSSE